MKFRFLLSFLAAATAASALPLGQFEDHGDLGPVKTPGHASYSEERQEYTITSASKNMWVDQDEFHGAWRQLDGDFIVQAEVAFEGAGKDPHRKMGIIVRSSLDPKSAHMNACRHGDGLTAVQFRRDTGSPTEESRFDGKDADVLQIERHAGVYRISVARRGETFTTQEFKNLALGERVFVGLYVCSHNADVAETGRFHNVRLIRPARDGFQPYREYIGSDVETLDLATGRRLVVHHEPDSIQAPNWTPDGKTLIMNHNGRMVSFDLASRVLSPIDTGEQIQCNNDHTLSWDGKQLGISSGNPSRVYTLPITGGTPKLITPLAPSYLHGWSPDNRFLVYTANRNGDYELYRISCDGGAEEQLTRSPGLDDGSEYSPDGKFIYFISERTGRMQLWRMNADGSRQTQLTFDDANNWFPHVSPDGKTLTFITYGTDIAPNDHPFYKHVYLRQMPAAGGAPKVIAYLYGGQGSFNVNSWSPDGRSIAFVSNSDKL